MLGEKYDMTAFDIINEASHSAIKKAASLFQVNSLYASSVFSVDSYPV